MSDVWTLEQAEAWTKRLGWLVGCNFIPSNAINQLEMWQEATFDVATIDRELDLAQSVGMNIVRVYLHDLLWEQDADGFTRRIDQFLGIAAGHGIHVLFTIFDDCHNAESALGTQTEPRPGIHNSGWVQSPGPGGIESDAEWPRLEKYVKGLLGAFGSDERIVLWDVYNEPGNNKRRGASLPLLRATFAWAREAAPSQPLSAGIWFDHAELNAFQLLNSDIVTFHTYQDSVALEKMIASLKEGGRPLLCTEWMARHNHSIPATCLPVFRREGVGCIMWGLVSGKTQTIYPWNSPASDEPPLMWFHDLFHQDGTPYRQDEVDCFRRLTQA